MAGVSGALASVISANMKPKTYRSLSTLAVATLLTTGCAVKGNVAVSEPTDGPRARVRIAALDEGPMRPYRGVSAYPNSTCRDKRVLGSGNVVNPSFGFEKTLNGQQRGMPLTPAAQDNDLRKAEIYVTANEPIALSYYRASSQSESVIGNLRTTTYYRDSCSASAQFVPQAGADYEVIFDAQRACTAQAFQLVSTGGQIVPMPVSVQPVPACPKQ